MHHRGAHLAVRSDPDPYQARAGNSSLVTGARRPVAALTSRSEERARGWKGVVVGDPLRPSLRPLGVLRLRHHRTREQGPRLIPGHPWRGVLQRKLGLVRSDRRAIGLQQRARRGPALPGASAATHAGRLPEGRFRRRRGDFVANGVLFAFYHLHAPWSIPAALADVILTAYPTRRWQSVWMSIIVHSAQSVFVIFAILSLVLS